MSNRERFTELMYEYEKNSFLLSILEARLSLWGTAIPSLR